MEATTIIITIALIPVFSGFLIFRKRWELRTRERQNARDIARKRRRDAQRRNRMHVLGDRIYHALGRAVNGISILAFPHVRLERRVDDRNGYYAILLGWEDPRSGMKGGFGYDGFVIAQVVVCLPETESKILLRYSALDTSESHGVSDEDATAVIDLVRGWLGRFVETRLDVMV